MPIYKFLCDTMPSAINRLMVRHIAAIGLMLVTGPASSSGSVQVQYLQDSSDTRDIFVDLTADLSKKASLSASVGNTRSPASAGDLDIDHWNIGLGYQLSKAFDIKLEVGSFGQGQDINTDTIDVELKWTSDNWSFSLKPQFDQIEVLLANLQTRKFDSNGIGVSIGYYGIQGWEYNLSYDTYDYSINPRVLSIPIVVAFLSSKALTVTSGLKDNIISADATWLLDTTDVTLSYARSKSAIDLTTSNIASLAFNFYQFLPYRIGIEAGAVGSDVDTASYYGGITLGYLW